VVVWNLGHLEPGAMKVLELTLRATDKGEFCFKTTAKADLGIEKTVDFCTKFAGASAMAVEMFGRHGALFVEQKTSFPVVVINQGSEPLTNIDVRAFIPDALKLERALSQYDEMEPALGGKWIKFKVLPKIDGGSRARYEIFVETLKAGVTRFHIEVRADQLTAGPVIEQEITNIVSDAEKLKIEKLSRTKSVELP
jgi:hypothetical protein